ncbi:MAG: sigma-70 family RNA polymerase sigma factor [Pyrinomonadaceae bacterium]
MFKQVRDKKSAERPTPFKAEAMPHMKTLFRVAMWSARDRHEAESLVQETFARALHSFHSFKPGTNCCAWLVAIMYLVNRERRRSLPAKLSVVSDNEEHISETVAYDPPTPPDATKEEVLRALDNLPPQFQEVLVLSDIEGMTYKEIADVLLVSTGTLMSRVSRGRKLLRAELARYSNVRASGSDTAAVASKQASSPPSASQDKV